MANDSIYKDEKCYQSIRYTEMGLDGREYVIQRWEQMADDTIYRDGK